MSSRHIIVLTLALSTSLGVMSCGLVGSDGPSELEIEYEARNMPENVEWEWQPGQDSMVVSISVDGKQIDQNVGVEPVLSGSFQVSRARGDSVRISAFIPSREDETPARDVDLWNAELIVRWANNRERHVGTGSGPYSGPSPPNVTVPLTDSSD